MVANDWDAIIEHETAQSYYSELRDFVDTERRAHRVYPPLEDELAALRITSRAGTKVVILGQDPYHGDGQAHGLSFSVRDGVRMPPSLRNIMNELHDDTGVDIPPSGNLTEWARRGVLLLNTTLTVREGAAGSHQGKGWERFTDAIISSVNVKNERTVFVLWGNHARRKRPLITNPAHFVVESAHPSPLSARNGFFGSRPFSRANAALIDAGIEPVDWSLTPSD